MGNTPRQPVKKRAKKYEPTEMQIATANAVVLEGKSFRSAALAAGYSENTANMGQTHLRRELPGMNSAFLMAAQDAQWRPNQLRSIAVHRIATVAQNGSDSDGLRAAEMIGRLKEVDMFVRQGDVQIGVFQSVNDAQAPELAALPEVNKEDK